MDYFDKPVHLSSSFQEHQERNRVSSATGHDNHIVEDCGLYGQFIWEYKAESKVDEEEEEEEEEEREELPAAFKKKSRIGISLSAVKELLGESVQLPMKVMVDVPGEGMRQHVWLRRSSSTQASFYINEPLLSKIKSCNCHHRK